MSVSAQVLSGISLFDYPESGDSLPLLNAWGKRRRTYQTAPQLVEYREVLTGSRSLMLGHCDLRMQEVATFYRVSPESDPQRVKHLKQWICPVCEHRVQRISNDPMAGSDFKWVASHTSA